MLKIGDVAIVYATWAPLVLALLCLGAAWRRLRARRALWRPPAALLALVALVCLGASMGGMPVVLNNAQLKALPSYQWSSVLRLGVSNVGDADPRWFAPSSTTCAIVGGDIGSQVPSADGGCFNAIATSGPQDVREWSADPTGAADSTGAINACLAASASCRADTGRFYAASQVKIPALGTLSCGEAKPMTSGAGWNTIAHTILYNPAISPAIIATGTGATIQNCAVLAHGLVFPISSMTGFGTGIVIDDGGKGDFTARNLVIVGDDSSLHVTGNRPIWDNINHWGTGNNEGDVRWDVGNTDSGSASNIEGAVGYFSGGGWICSPGTGFYVGGASIGAAGVFMHGKIVEEGYKTAQFDFENSAIADALWADNDSAVCGFNASIGVKVAPQVHLSVTSLTSSQSQTGVLDQGYITSVETYIEYVGQDGLDLGSSGGGGTFKSNSLVVAGGTPRYAINVTNAASQLSVTTALLSYTTTPLINNSSGSNIALGAQGAGGQIWFGTLQTGLGAGANPFSTTAGSTFTLSAGSEGARAGLTMTISVAGIGTGTASLGGGSNVDAGAIDLLPAGTPTAAATVTQTLPLQPTHFSTCLAQTGNSTGAWSSPVVQVGQGSLVLTNGTAFTAGKEYDVHYLCQYY